VNRGTLPGTDSILVYGYFLDFQHFNSAARRIAPLDVGETRSERLRFLVADGTRWVKRPGHASLAQGVFAIAGQEFLEEDADPTNNVGASVAFQPRTAILDIALSDLPDTLRTHTPYPASLSVTNRSPFAAHADTTRIVFCASHFAHPYCEQGLVATHSATDVGPVGAGGHVDVQTTIEFTGESLWYFDSESFVFMRPCLPAAGSSTPTCLHAPDPDDFRVAIPDLVAECLTAALEPPDTLYAVNAYCLGDGAAEGMAHAIGVFDGLAGECYRVTRLGDQWSASVLDSNLAIVPRDPATDCHRLPHDGTYYLNAHAESTANPAGGIVVIEST